MQVGVEYRRVSNECLPAGNPGSVDCDARAVWHVLGFLHLQGTVTYI